MQWDPFEEYKHRNKMWFNMYKPNEVQLDMLDKLSNKNAKYNECGLFSKSSYYPEDEDEHLFILTHPIVEEIIKINSNVFKSVHIPLGYINFMTFSNLKFEHMYTKESYGVFYVESRCSFGKWPEFKNYIKLVSDIEHQKVNIGQILGLFLEGLAKKYKKEQKIDKVFLFNMSLETAVKSHEKNGWEFGADIELSYLKDKKSGKNGYDIFKRLKIIDDNDEYKMFKIV